MKIAVCTIGSRGDIQPFLVLGNALAQRGHQVRFATAQMYSSLVARYTVEFTPFSGDYGTLVDSQEMKRVIGANPFTISKNLKEKVYPIIENSLETFLEVAKWADAVVYHPKTLIDAFGSLFPEKLIKAYVVPAFVPTKEFPSPAFSGLPIPPFLNRVSYKMTNALIGTVKGPIQAFCSKHDLPKKIELLDTLTIYGISPHFIPKPPDYPEHHHFTGFWFDSSSTELPEQLLQFFTSKKKKLIITFGSMPYKSKIDINKFISAILAQMDVRVLLVRGWGLKDIPIAESEEVLAIDSAPFDKLFPLADAIVHHGGAGTTASALQAGLPMMICPVLHPVGDQMFWGRKAHEAGLGVPPIPLSQLTLFQFVNSMRQLLGQDFSLASQRMRDNLAQEDGLAKAVEIIEQK